MLLTTIRDAILTREPDLRARLGMWLTSTVTYLAYDALLLGQVAFGWVGATPAGWLVAVSTIANAGFYIALRWRWSERLARDKSLGRPQLLLGIVFFWATYAITGPASSATLVIVISHTVYAVFAMPARVRQMALGSVVGLAIVMVACHAMDPARYPAELQLMALLYTALVVALVTRLEGLVAGMTGRIRTQRNQLEQALAQVRQLALRDELTQLNNRRHMIELVESALRQARHGGRPACIALLDIDHFKRVNDDHGHPAGDAVLRRFASLLKSSLRESDVAGRWGGEEFLVLMPIADEREATAALQRVQAHLVLERFGAADASAFQVTFSAGVVSLAPQHTLEQCIAAADRALYRAKQRGRNRIEAVLALDEADEPGAPLREQSGLAGPARRAAWRPLP